MARSADQLSAWAELLELCEDECEVFRTSATMRGAIVEVELELARLHKIEVAAIEIAQLLKRLRDEDADSTKWEDFMQDLWDNEAEICARIESLVPQAFTVAEMLSSIPTRAP